MELLRLYLDAVSAVVETVDPLDRNPSCRLCDLSQRNGVRNVCIGGDASEWDGQPGGVLIVGDAPGADENLAGRPFVGAMGRYLRPLVSRWKRGRGVVYDLAARCWPGKDLIDKDLDACRGYLRQTIDEVRPSRIIALGTNAVYAILGRGLAPMTNRRAYGWLSDSTPVFALLHPVGALRNRFVRTFFEADLQWAMTAEVPFQPAWNARVKVVATLEDAQQAATEMRQAEWFAFDCETCGKMFEQGFTVIALACCAKGASESWVWDGAALQNGSQTKRILCELLADPKAKKVGQNIKYDQLAVRKGLGTVVRGVHGDTRLWRKLMDPEADGHLAVMAELVGMGGHKEEADAAMAAVMKQLRKGGPDSHLLDGLDPATESTIRLGGFGSDYKSYAFALLPRETLLRYNARDAVSTAYLGDLLEQRLHETPQLERIWREVVHPASLAIEQIEAWGIGIDATAVLNFQTYLATELGKIQGHFALYGPTFNPNSTKQVAELLFTQLGLPVLKLTDSGKPSTDKEALEALRGTHPIADNLLGWRRLSKLKGTYADGLLEHISTDARIHPNFKIDGTRSGRISCDSPNLQNIPRAKDSAEGKMARDCFVAPPGHTLIEADYSQLELRVAAMLSGDPLMREIFVSGEDYHLRTAQMVAKQMWNITPDQIEDKHRTAAKTVNFRTLYGGADAGLAKMLGCSVDTATRLREAIFGRFRVLAAWIKAQLASAQRTGTCHTWWNGKPARIRQLYRLADQDDSASELRSVAEHSSWNTPIQGTAHEFCLASLTKVVDYFADPCEPNGKLVLAVHDSILCEVKDEDAPEVALAVKGIMQGWPTMNDVPLVVDLKIGKSWGALEKYDVQKTQ